jgi:hypothetical protein
MAISCFVSNVADVVVDRLDGTRHKPGGKESSIRFPCCLLFHELMHGFICRGASFLFRFVAFVRANAKTFHLKSNSRPWWFVHRGWFMPFQSGISRLFLSMFWRLAYMTKTCWIFLSIILDFTSHWAWCSDWSGYERLPLLLNWHDGTVSHRVLRRQPGTTGVFTSCYELRAGTILAALLGSDSSLGMRQ